MLPLMMMMTYRPSAVCQRMYLVTECVYIFDLAPQIVHEVFEGLEVDCCTSPLRFHGSSTGYIRSRYTVLLTVILMGRIFAHSLAGRQQLT